MHSHVVAASMFIDYYELLEISPNANSETIERIFRYFALRYHPDNQDTGDELRFSEILEAHNTLKDPVKRAQYDIEHRYHSDLRGELAEEASNPKGIEWDAVGRPPMGDPIGMLVHAWCWRYCRRGRRSGSGVRSRPLDRLRGGWTIAKG